MRLGDSVQADGNSTGVGNPPGYCYAEQPAWSAYRESSFGHGTLDILDETYALWSCEPLLSPVTFRSAVPSDKQPVQNADLVLLR